MHFATHSGYFSLFMEASVIPLISPGHETPSFLYEDFYTTLRVGAGSYLLPQNLLQQKGKPAPSFHTPQNPCTQAAHSEFVAPEEAAEGNLPRQS